MAYPDEHQQVKAQARNVLQSIALIAGIGLITALSAYILSGGEGVIWALALVGIFVLIGPRIAPEAIMRMFNGRFIDPTQGGEITKIIRELSDRAGLPSTPQLYVIPSQTLNAFAIGNRSRAFLAITEGLLRRLDLRELSGVLAHEITHVQNNDIWVMSLADVFSRLTRFMSFFAVFLLFVSLPAALTGSAPTPWLAILILYFAPALSSLLQLALSRSREYDADIGGATLTGDAESLASALKKVERYQGRVWEDMFMPNRRIPAPSVLRTHPSTADRVARLKILQKPTFPPLAIPNTQGYLTGFTRQPSQARFHWSGFWF